MPEREIHEEASCSLDREPLPEKPALASSEQQGEAGWRAAGYLHGGTVSLAADQCGGDIGVSVFIIQIYHIGHPAWQEQLVPLVRLVLEQDAVNVAAWTEGQVWESRGKGQSEAFLIYQQHKHRLLRTHFLQSSNSGLSPSNGFHFSVHPPGFLPHSQHRQGGEQPHAHSLTQPGLKFNFVLRIFIFPKQKQKPVVLEPSEWLLCIFHSGNSCTQECKILNHSLSFLLGLLHHFLLFLLLAGNLSPYLDAEYIHTLQPNPCYCCPSVSPIRSPALQQPFPGREILTAKTKH